MKNILKETIARSEKITNKLNNYVREIVSSQSKTLITPVTIRVPKKVPLDTKEQIRDANKKLNRIKSEMLRDLKHDGTKMHKTNNAKFIGVKELDDNNRPHVHGLVIENGNVHKSNNAVRIYGQKHMVKQFGEGTAGNFHVSKPTMIYNKQLDDKEQKLQTISNWNSYSSKDSTDKFGNRYTMSLTKSRTKKAVQA